MLKDIIAMNIKNISLDFIEKICVLYNDVYDDREEASCPPAAGDKRHTPGADWKPGVAAGHKSLIAFQRELAAMGIKLSTSKIRKILISGGCWTTERSREVQKLFLLYTKPETDGGEGLTEADAVKRISNILDISLVSVSVNLPYYNVVYKLENKTSNARRCERYKARQRMKDQGNVALPVSPEIWRNEPG